MLEPDADLGIHASSVLPWVPDIVGKEADGDRAILIFGAAYAGFIREYSCRGACLRLAEYAISARNGGGDNWTAFQRAFLENVVVPDIVYYGRLASLLSSVGVSANRVVVSDLCPCSIVKRTVINNRRQDDSRQPCKDRASVFCWYVEHPVVEGWTWRRVTESLAARIIALGHIAEHGLLRLFSRHGAMISRDGQRLSDLCQGGTVPAWGWVDRYADPGRKLAHWLKPGRWWTISINGRNVQLLPVYHPSTVDNYDPGYRQTGQALAAWLPR